MRVVLSLVLGIVASFFSSFVLAELCTAVFPDPVSSNHARGYLQFNSNAKVIGSDGTLDAVRMVDHTRGSSCDSAGCKISGQPSAQLSLPSFERSQSTQDVTLNKASNYNLPAGHYDDIRLNNRSSITTTTHDGIYHIDTLELNSNTSMYLDSGTYWINSIRLNSNTRLVLKAGASVTLYVNTFTMNSGSQVNQENDANPSNLLLVSYDDVTFNSRTFINAFVYAVDDARYNSNSTHIGAISAESVRMNSRSTVSGPLSGMGTLPGNVCSTQLTLPDPIGHWSFDVCSLTGEDNDVPDIASGNHGSSFNLPGIQSSGKYCQAGQFRGQGDAVHISHVTAYATADFSVSLWVNTDDLSFTNNSVNGGMALISKDRAGLNGGEFSLFLTSSGSVKVIQQTPYNSLQLQSAPVITEGQWHHIVYSAGSDGVQIFVDSILVASDNSYTGGLVNNSADPVLGVYTGNMDNSGFIPSAASDYFKGEIDDVRFYDQQLSAGLVSLLYSQSGGDCQTCQSTAFKIAHWDFDVCSLDGQSGTVVDVKNGINGITQGNVSSDENGRFCQALGFDGGSYVNIPHHHGFALAEGTLSVWLNVESHSGDPSDRQAVLSKDGAQGRSDGQFTLAVDGQGYLLFTLGNAGQTTTLYTAQTITAGQWHHVVFQWSGSRVQVYLDGVYQGGNSTAYSWEANSQPIVFGSSTANLPNNVVTAGLLSDFFTGQIDDVQFFNGELSNSEIQALYSASDYGCQSCSGIDPQAYFQFEEEQWLGRNAITDSSNNNNHATAVNNVYPDLPDNAISCRAMHVPANYSVSVDAMDTEIDVNDIGSKGTISFWYKANEDWQSGNARMLFDATSSYFLNLFRNSFYAYIDANGRISMSIEDALSARFDPTSDAMNFAAGDWVHIAVTWNLPAQEVGLLINGQTRRLYGNYQFFSTSLDAISTLKIGDWSSNAVYSYGTINSANGAFDDVRIYDYVLSEDEVAGDMQTVTSCSSLHHFEITHPQQALTCEGADVTIKACGNATCDELFGDPINVQVALGNGEDSKTVNFTGQTSVHLEASSEGSTDVSVASLESNVQPVERDQCTTDCAVSFVHAGFQFFDNASPYTTLLPDVIAGNNLSTVGLRAVQNNAGRCESLLAGQQTVTLGIDCISPLNARYSPDVCQVPLTGIPIQGNGSGESSAAVSLTFDQNGETTLSDFSYGDVGKIQLSASASIEGKQITSGGVILNSIPASLEVNTNTQSPHVAGNVFSFSITALDINSNAVPGYQPGQLQARLTRLAPLNVSAADSQMVIAPNVAVTSGTTINWSGISAATFSGGMYQSNQAYLEEVGTYETAVQDAAYLGHVISSNNQSLGRFIPAYFDVQHAGSVRLAPRCGGEFTYIGQSVDFEPGSEPLLTVTAYNSKGQLTKNYSDENWRLNLNSASLSDISYSNESAYTGGLALDSAGAPPLLTGHDNFDGNGDIWFTGAKLHYNKLMIPGAGVGGGSPFNASIAITYSAAMLTDTDGVCYQSNYPQQCQAYQIASVTGGEMRYGRLRFENAFGPETETLRLPVIAEYFDNGNWLVNTDDSCTAIGLTQSSGQITLENTSIGNDEQDITGLLSGIAGSGTLTNGESENGVIAVGPAMSNGVAVRGSVRIRLDPAVPGANWANHLNIDWDGDGDIDADDSPTADLFFGIYRGNDRTIHMREGF